MSLIRFDQFKDWFFSNRRSLPWRENSSPYEVWISEVMLQQTQVAVVIPYFKRWMQLFPTIEVLAQASLDIVIKAWEGLGYYSRARNLYEGARYLVQYHGGELPEDGDALQNVKGVGPYTAGAIQSFAFKKKAAAVDGNVLRVCSRLFAIEMPIDQQKTRRYIEKLVTALLPDDEPWIVMEAFIELGALVCQKKPNCVRCPLKGNCLAFQKEKTADFPKKGKKRSVTVLHRLVTIIQSGADVLVKQVEEGKVMAGLWEFPYLDLSHPVEDLSEQHTYIEKHFSLSLIYQRAFPVFSHGFTRYQAFLYPFLWRASRSDVVPNHDWIPLKDLPLKPFSSGHRRLLTYLLQN